MSDRDDLVKLCLPFVRWGNGNAGSVGELAGQHAAGELADVLLAAGWRAPTTCDHLWEWLMSDNLATCASCGEKEWRHG